MGDDSLNPVVKHETEDEFELGNVFEDASTHLIQQQYTLVEEKNEFGYAEDFEHKDLGMYSTMFNSITVVKRSTLKMNPKRNIIY